MDVRTSSWVLGAAAAVFGLLSGAPRAEACGGFFCDNTVAQPPVQNAERIVFVRDGATTTAIVQILYQGDPTEFSWVVPVAARPTLGVGDPAIFDVLDRQTAPSFQFLTDRGGSTGTTASSGGCSSESPASAESGGAFSADAGAVATDSGVTVVGAQSLGPYETVLLSADDPEALTDWLTANDYAIPPNAMPLIAYYVERDHYWVALKLRSDANVLALDPLSITYEGESCIPILLTQIATVPVLDVIAWFVGDAPVRSMNYASIPFEYQDVRMAGFAGTDYRTRVQSEVDARGGHGFVTELAVPREQIPATGLPELDALLDRGAWVTRLYTTLRAEDMTMDPMFAEDPSVPEQSNSHVIDLRTPPPTTDFDGCAAAPASADLLGLGLPLALAGGVAFAFSRRRRR